MTRSITLVRRATPDDVPELCRLLADLRDGEERATPAHDPTMPDRGLAERLQAALVSPECAVLVADGEAGPIAVAVCQQISLGPLSGERALQVSHLVVDRRQRHRGVGHALVAAAAALAEEWGLPSVVAGVYPGLREANRFYARLGFAPLAVRRITPVSGLRRRLAGPTRRSVISDAARRRSLARRLAVRAGRG